MILLQDSVCIAHQISITIRIQDLASCALEELAILSNKNNVCRHQLVLGLMGQIMAIHNAHRENSMMSYWDIVLITITLEYAPMINLIMISRLTDVWSAQPGQGLTMSIMFVREFDIYFDNI